MFGKWVVISGPVIHKRQRKWLCKCECGSEKLHSRSTIKGVKTFSCSKCSQIGHDKRHHFLYDTWAAMKARCYCKTNKGYFRYGGRGIKVCDRWMDFLNFISDLEPTWKSGLSLGRIDNNGDYCPENCRWETAKQQSNNTRRNRLIAHNGKTQTMQQWADEMGVNGRLIQFRISHGWPQNEWLLPKQRIHVKA